MAIGILTLIVLLPILAALVIILLPQDSEARQSRTGATLPAPEGASRDTLLKVIALAANFGSLLLSILAFLWYDRNPGGFQFVEKFDWLPGLNISYHVGGDGMNLPLALLTGVVGVTAVIASWGIKERVREYFALMGLSIAGVFGVFLTLDLFFFILFYELASIPIYFLIGMWGSHGKNPWRETRREYAALKLLLYLQLGGALILVSFLALYFAAPESGLSAPTFNFVELFEHAKFSTHLQTILFPLLFIAFGIEAGLFPFHTWLPDGHSAAPTAISMILAGVILKMGGYGMMRIAIGLLPEGARIWLPFFAVIGVINILYGAYCALRQVDIKYIVAYSSISHMGIVFLGLATLNMAGFSGALFQMVSHGFITALLFALAGLIYEKTHTRLITEYGGLASRLPFLTAAFVVGGLASLGLPTMSGFVAEFLVFLGAYSYQKILAVAAVAGLLITTTYILWTVQRVFFGPLNLKEAYAHLADAAGIERVHLVMLIFVIVLFGIFPNLLVGMGEGSLFRLLNRALPTGMF